MSFKSITNNSNPNKTTNLYCGSLNLKGSALAVPSPSWLNNVRASTTVVLATQSEIVVFGSGTAVKTDDITTVDDSKYTFVNGGVYNVSYNVGLVSAVGTTANILFNVYDASGVFVTQVLSRAFVASSVNSYAIFDGVVSISKGFSVALAVVNSGISSVSVVNPSMSFNVLTN